MQNHAGELSGVQQSILKRTISLRGEEIVLEIVNSLEAEQVDTLKAIISPFFRKVFGKDQLQITAELRQEEESNIPTLYTSGDKFQYLIKKKPILQKLRDELGLDPDF